MTTNTTIAQAWTEPPRLSGNDPSNPEYIPRGPDMGLTLWIVGLYSLALVLCGIIMARAWYQWQIKRLQRKIELLAFGRDAMPKNWHAVSRAGFLRTRTNGE